MSTQKIGRGVLGLLLFVCTAVLLVDARECTEEDWLWQYTTCRAGQRALIYYKNPDTDDCSEGVAKPDNVFGLPCDVSCPAGTYLPPGSLECKGCPVGSYSLSGGVRVDEWKGFPTSEVATGVKFDTWAAYRDNLDVHLQEGGWTVLDGSELTIRSGIINSSQASVLQLKTHLVKDGGIVFAFRVDCEQSYDGLEFYVDDVAAMNLTFGVHELKTVTFPLTRGYHTLEWRYVKDVSVSQGADAAFIRFVELDGTTFAADSCLPCPPGSASNVENASVCAYCPRNTYTDVSGRTECSQCPSTQYAPAGSSECYDRYTCTENDYVPVYGPCAFDQASQTYRRTKSYAWVVGTKCDHAHATLPDSTTVECPKCNPGMYRDSNGQCVSCPAGTVASGADAECKACGAGEESMPGIYIRNWYRESELPQMSTGCDGDCGTDGWVLDGDHIISGWGHGTSVESWVQFNFTTVRRSKVVLNYTVRCPSWDCRLSMYDVGYSSLAYFSGQGNVDYIDLPAGEHTLRFVYTRFHGVTENNYAMINKLDILASYSTDGIAGTGGESCSKCKVGYHSSQGDEWCEPCPVGTTSNDEGTQCVDCPEDSFNDLVGGTCKECGKNVHSDPGSAQCDTNCRFSPADGVTYDLSALQKDTMYGPIYDSAQFEYYINLCSRFNSSRAGGVSPCKSYYGDPIDSFACQIYHDCPAGRVCGDFNIGDQLDIEPLEGKKGFNLTYTGGDYGCSRAGRNTTVTMLCKPGGGVGVPGPWPGQATIEGPPCNYNILWESIYGCPLCTEDDYTFVYGECKNGYRRMIYQWRTNPLACHDGVSLPPDEDVPSQCIGEVVCPVGHYFNDETSVCTPCEAGTYSPGAGYAYYSFSGIPERFTSTCGASGACTPFFTSGGVLHSGLGNSVLVYTSQFLVDGYVNFTYSLISADGVDATTASHFDVLLDGESVFGDLFGGVSMTASRELSFEVTAGSHMISFEIDAFSAGSYVQIEKMFIYGDRYAPLYCPVCGDGLIQPDAVSGMCVRCSGNTVPNDAHTACVPCEDGKYTIDCKTCVGDATCTEDNFVALYTPCKNGKRAKRYVKVEPTFACQGGYVPPEDEENLDCEPCPVGMHREAGSDECVGCPSGSYYDSYVESCTEAHEGSIALNTMTFFKEGESGETELPSGWSTFAMMATFPVGTVNGWRVGNGFVDCGPNVGNGRYVSVLEYKTSDLVTDLQVQFEYLLSDNARLRGSSLQFFVNGKMYDYVVTAAEGARDSSTVFVQTKLIKIPYAETVTLRFVASVWTGDLNTVFMKDSDVQIRNVVITGLANGVSKEEECPAGMQNNQQHNSCVLCEAGSSNDVAGQMCQPCPEGAFTSAPGEDYCTACYPGTTSEHQIGSSRCVTSCVFQTTGFVYNMSALAGSVIGPVTSLSSENQFYLSVCDGVMKEGECNSQATGVENMHVCVPGEGSERINYGSELEFVDTSDQSSDTPVVLKYHVSSLSTETAAACKGREILTTIYFRCDPTVGIGFPTLLPGDECAPSFTWTSQYACRTCDTSDYEEVLSKCESGSQRKELYRKDDAKCNGEARIFVEELECTDISLSLGVILGVGAVILVLAGVIIFVVWRNREITVKYTKLLQSQEGDLEAMAAEEADAELERKEAESSKQFSSATTATF